MTHYLNKHYKEEERYKAILDHGKGLLVINAGPGTGKTWGLIRKIENLLQKKADPDKIYYLTFANNILDAFKHDIAKPVKEDGLGKTVKELGIHASTLHSLGFKIIKTYAERLKLPDFIETFDLDPYGQFILSRKLTRDVYHTAKAKLGTTWVKFNQDIKKLKQSWQKELPIDDDIKEFSEIVLNISKRYQAMPWDLLVPRANEVIEKHGLPRWLKDAQHFLIDEFQDFNPSEQKLIEFITEPSDSVIIVGDTDQSIYSGRSASPVGLNKLLEGKETYSVNLVHCWRCPEVIICLANKILSRIDPESFKSKKLFPSKKERGNFELKSFKSSRAEIDYIAQKINEWRKMGEDLEIVMLFPIKKGIEFYRKGLEKRRIKCFVSQINNQEEFLIAYLKLIIFGSHPLLYRLLLSNFPNLNKKFQNEVLPLFIEEKKTLSQTLEEVASSSSWGVKVSKEYEEYKAKIANLKSRNSEIILKELKSLGYEIKIEMVEELLGDLPEKYKHDKLNSMLDKIIRDDNLRDFDVYLLTMHGSKGLNKDLVIIPAFEDKWLPGNSKEEALKEKHRLFYVAVTRSRRGLLMTYPRTRARKDPLNYTPRGTRRGISRYAKLIMNF